MSTASKTTTAAVTEMKCGCMFHTVVGLIRKCPGTTSRSLSGRMIQKPEGAEAKHNNAMADSAVRSYDVADIMP